METLQANVIVGNLAYKNLARQRSELRTDVLSAPADDDLSGGLSDIVRVTAEYRRNPSTFTQITSSTGTISGFVFFTSTDFSQKVVGFTTKTIPSPIKLLTDKIRSYIAPEKSLKGKNIITTDLDHLLPGPIESKFDITHILPSPDKKLEGPVTKEASYIIHSFLDNESVPSIRSTNIKMWDTNYWYGTDEDEPNKHVRIIYSNSLSRNISKHFIRFTKEELIYSLNNYSNLPYSKILAKRIQELSKYAEEEFPEQEPLSVDSLENFINFIEQNSNIKCPKLALSYTGNIKARWSDSKRKKITIEFFDDTDINTFVVYPNKIDSNKTIRVSQSFTQDLILEFLEKNELLNLLF